MQTAPLNCVWFQWMANGRVISGLFFSYRCMGPFVIFFNQHKAGIDAGDAGICDPLICVGLHA